MSQSRTHSFIEACANIALGYGIAVGAQIFILPMIDVHIDMGRQLVLANYMTVVSLVRSYSLRRFFNWIHARAECKRTKIVTTTSTCGGNLETKSPALPAGHAITD